MSCASVTCILIPVIVLIYLFNEQRKYVMCSLKRECCVWLAARTICQLCGMLCTLTPDKLSVVSYDPLAYSRHTTENRSVKVGHEIKSTSPECIVKKQLQSCCNFATKFFIHLSIVSDERMFLLFYRHTRFEIDSFSHSRNKSLNVTSRILEAHLPLLIIRYRTTAHNIWMCLEPVT